MTRILRLTALVVVALAATACGPDTTVDTRAAAQGSPSSTPESTAAPQPKGTYLYDVQRVFDVASVPVVSGKAKVGGQVYEHSTYSALGCAVGTQTWDFDLNGEYASLTATAGVSDNSPAGAGANFVFRLDGQPVGQAAVAAGRPGPVTLDVTGRLRLQVAVTGTGPPLCVPSVPVGTYAVLADATLNK